MKRRTDHEPGYVLHSYPYKETSLIVEAFTRRHGRLGLLARGARRPRSAIRGMLLAFHPLGLSWSGSGDLGTLRSVDWAGTHRAPAGLGLMCGFYLNELLMRLLPRDDPHERLFDAYAESLRCLAEARDQEPVLRAFERRLLGELGYAPLLEHDAISGAPIEPGQRYMYEPDRGPVAVRGEHAPPAALRGQTLLDIANDDYARADTRDEARRLLRELIAHRLGGQTLHTRTVLKELQDL
ncbi:MAG TPA: DNA repair protein RecO [Burkholderiales bacterium]|jgi:DNA repair protein RecO (recombination protein O)|nr:DNA repair protein RecO [Burkholderiales bacterium]